MHRKIFVTLASAAAAMASSALPAAAHMDVVYPNGGEVLAACVNDQIIYSISDDDGPGTILIELSIDGGATWFYVNQSNFAGGTGTFTYSPWLVPEAESTNCLVRVTYTHAQGSDFDVSDAPFTIEEDIEIMVLDATVGGTLQWHHHDPCHPGPGFLGVTWTSLTGDSTTLTLNPGGVQVQCTPDFWTILLISTGIGITAYDGMGMGDTVPIPVPNNQNLVGLNMWAAVATFEPFLEWHSASATINFQLQ